MSQSAIFLSPSSSIYCSMPCNLPLMYAVSLLSSSISASSSCTTCILLQSSLSQQAYLQNYSIFLRMRLWQLFSFYAVVSYFFRFFRVSIMHAYRVYPTNFRLNTFIFIVRVLPLFSSCGLELEAPSLLLLGALGLMSQPVWIEYFWLNISQQGVSGAISFPTLSLYSLRLSSRNSGGGANQNGCCMKFFNNSYSYSVRVLFFSYSMLLALGCGQVSDVNWLTYAFDTGGSALLSIQLLSQLLLSLELNYQKLVIYQIVDKNEKQNQKANDTHLNLRPLLKIFLSHNLSCTPSILMLSKSCMWNLSYLSCISFSYFAK